MVAFEGSKQGSDSQQTALRMRGALLAPHVAKTIFPAIEEREAENEQLPDGYVRTALPGVILQVDGFRKEGEA